MVPPKLLTLPGSRGAFLCSALRPASVATRRDASTRQTPQTVVVPARIDRGPTDVLKAIAATVGTDYTAAHYKYHDDPYLLPSSNMSKRVFALAKESGRKAARYIRDKHSDYFLHQEADPFIPAFAPKLAVPEDPSKLSVEDLERAIELGDVEDAQKIYELLCLGECAMDVSIRQKLLELLCFYNSQQGPDPAFLDERWYTASSQTRELRKKVWKDGGLVDDVFNSLPDPKTPEAYSAIIRGMTKYYQVEKAWTYFQNAKKDGVLLDTETYNAIIRVVTFLKEGPERCWETILGLLSEMRQASIKPNLGTLNAVLENISSLGAWRARMDLALSTLAEFSRSGVQPCLGSYYLILNIFYKERGGVTTIIYDIIERLESDGLQEEAVDTRDTNFFVTAMDIAANKLGDLSLGQRLHQLLLTGRNYDFIGDAYKESIYYRNYFTLLHQSLPVDDFMDNYYEKLVPFIYTPEPSVMQNVLKAVDMSAAVRYIPRLWSDMIVFDHTSRQQLVETVCSMLQAHLPDIEEGEADKVLNVGRDLFDRVEAMVHERSANFVSWTGEMLGNLMMLYAHRGDLDYCGKVLAKLKDSKYEIVGLPQFASLSTYLDQLTKADQPNRQGSLPQAVEIVVYAHDCAYPEARDLALKLSDRFELDNTVRDKINLAFGEKLYPELVQEVLTEEEIYRRRRMSMSE